MICPGIWNVKHEKKTRERYVGLEFCKIVALTPPTLRSFQLRTCYINQTWKIGQFLYHRKSETESSVATVLMNIPPPPKQIHFSWQRNVRENSGFFVVASANDTFGILLIRQLTCTHQIRFIQTIHFDFRYDLIMSVSLNWPANQTKPHKFFFFLFFMHRTISKQCKCRPQTGHLIQPSLLSIRIANYTQCNALPSNIQHIASILLLLL